jgi:hypothetical protein
MTPEQRLEFRPAVHVADMPRPDLAHLIARLNHILDFFQTPPARPLDNSGHIFSRRTDERHHAQKDMTARLHNAQQFAERVVRALQHVAERSAVSHHRIERRRSKFGQVNDI